MSSVTGAEADGVPAVLIVSADPPFTSAVQAASEYTLYVTVPVAVLALSPDSVAVSVTAVPTASVSDVPEFVPSDSEVVTVVGVTSACAWVMPVSGNATADSNKHSPPRRDALPPALITSDTLTAYVSLGCRYYLFFLSC